MRNNTLLAKGVFTGPLKIAGAPSEPTPASARLVSLVKSVRPGAVWKSILELLLRAMIIGIMLVFNDG